MWEKITSYNRLPTNGYRTPPPFFGGYRRITPNLMVYKQSKLFITEAIKATSKYNFEKKNLRRSCIILNGKYYRQEKEE